MRRWSTFVELASNFFNFFKMLFRHWANGHLLEILYAYQQLLWLNVHLQPWHTQKDKEETEKLVDSNLPFETF